MKRNKIYYIPGWITLMVLPVILLTVIPEEMPYPTCIRMYIPSDELPNDTVITFSKHHVLESIKSKKVTEIEIGEENTRYAYGEQLYDAKLNFIRKEIERITFTHDSSAVLKVTMEDECRYGDFIWILNLLQIYGVKRYALVDNSLYIFGNDPIQ
jgi:hypothetical protein